MSKPKVVGNVAAPTVIIMILIGIMIFLMLVSPETREELIPTDTEGLYSRVVFSQSPGLLSTDEWDAYTSFTRVLPEITVDNTAKNVTTDIISYGITKRRIIAKTVEFSLNTNTEGFSELYLDFDVHAKEGEGLLQVEVNGNLVYETETASPSHITVPLTTFVIDGANRISITIAHKTSKFWELVSYHVKDVKITASEYSEAKPSIQTFSIDPSRYDDIQIAEFRGYLRKQGESGTVVMTLNGNEIFNQAVISNKNLEFSVTRDLFVEGINELRVYSPERGTKFELDYAKFEFDIEESYTKTDTSDYDFALSTKEWEEIRNKKYTCELYVTSGGGGDNHVNIKLNAHSLKFFFIADEINQTVCDYLKQGDNSIRFYASDEVDIDLAKITVKASGYWK